MNEKEINKEYEKIIRLLRQKRLKEAHTQLLYLMGEKGEWGLRMKLEQLQTSYQYMLQYLRQGTQDPDRAKLYQRILTETWEIADQIHISLLDDVSTSYYHRLHKTSKNMTAGRMYDWLRKLESFQDDLAVAELMPGNETALKEVLKRHEDANKFLFLTTWGNTAWSREDIKDAQQILVSEQLSSNDRSLFISALTLSLQEYFDIHKFLWLLTAVTKTDDVQSVQRALVGIALTMLRHPDKAELYPELTERLAMLDEKYHLGKNLNIIYLQLLCAQETEKINKRITEEIIPEILKKAQNFKGMEVDWDELSEEEDVNPDWEKAMQDTSFENKIREMTDLQMEGMDVNLSTFAQLKRFSFFNEATNWFLPFDKNHSCIREIVCEQDDQSSGALNMFLQSGLFCNSDKYSMCLFIASIPESQRRMMIANIAQKNIEEMLDDDHLNNITKIAQAPAVISNLYIQDLYRFYKLNKAQHEDLIDPFSQDIILHRIPALAPLLSKPEQLEEVADYRVKKDHPLEAIDIYLQLVAQQAADADIFQKLGYCYQKLKHYEEAIDAFRKADILKPDHLWTLRHLATCYRINRQFDKAMEYYQKVEEIEPDNKTIIYFKGRCFMKLERYDEALNCFFKLDFMETNNVKAWRSIGWCSFLCGKLEQARKYYDKVLNTQPNANDYLNAGHVAWKSGNREQTATLYGKAVMMYGNKDIFWEHFQKDKGILLSQGITPDEIPLVLDMI